MTIARGVMNKFNRGEVSPAGFAREDVNRIDNSCEQMLNFLPQRLGSMQLRPGTELIDINIDNETILVPFVTEIADPIILLFSLDGASPKVEFIRNDTLIARTAVTSSLQNEGFILGFAAGEWVNADEGSAVSTMGGSKLIMTGTGTDSAKVYQTLDNTQNAAPHGFRIRIIKGQLLCQLGTDGVDSADLFEGTLREGFFNIEVTPFGGPITITLSNDNLFFTEVRECSLQGAGTILVQLEVAFNANFAGVGEIDRLRALRYAQSADVMYFASKYFVPFMIKRLGSTSFSVEIFENVFGPYEVINTSSITMNPTVPLEGDTQIVSSKGYFDSNSLFGFVKGTLLKMAVVGQFQTTTLAVVGNTENIFVFGSGNARQFDLDIVVNSGSGWTVLLEKSFDEISFQTVATYTTVQNIQFNDALDTTEIFYRLRVSVIGTANLTLTLDYSYGTVESQGRIRSRANSTTVDVEWYVPLNQDQTVRDWYIGSWGGKRGFPSAISFYEGRLWFAGGNKIWGSETDFYRSFDRNLEGASASIQRTIGFGSAEEILWLTPSARLVAGTSISEIDVRSTTFGEVLTDLNTNLKIGSDKGCADIAPIVIDQEIIFVQRGGDRLIGIDFNISSEKHSLEDFNILNPEVLSPGIIRMAFARNPETRIYLVMSDGTMRVLLRDVVEDVLGWSRISIAKNNGAIDNIIDVCVIPGDNEDQVYISTDSSKLLKFSKTTEVAGASLSKHFDSFQVFLSPGATVQLSTKYVLNDVVGVWVDGVDDGTYIVNGSSQITGVTIGVNVVVGFKYSADYKTNKLTGYKDLSVLASRKRILNTGLLLRNYKTGSITIGPDIPSLSAMPLLEDGQAPVSGDYDFFPFEYSGVSETDPRIHIRATGPCDILALVYDVKNTSRRTRRLSNSNNGALNVA